MCRLTGRKIGAAEEVDLEVDRFTKGGSHVGFTQSLSTGLQRENVIIRKLHHDCAYHIGKLTGCA